MTQKHYSEFPVPKVTKKTHIGKCSCGGDCSILLRFPRGPWSTTAYMESRAIRSPPVPPTGTIWPESKVAVSLG